MKQKFSWPTAIDSFRMSEHTVRHLTELAGSLKGDSKTHILELLGILSSKVGDQVFAHRWLLVGYLQTIEESFDSGGEDHPMISKLLEESKQKGVGQKYLIQHSAGSGKSNSISWLAHQLASLFNEDGKSNVFDSILIITDRTILDSQLGGNVKSFDHQIGVIVAVESGKELQEALESGKRIIITTIQKFPVIADAIGELSSQKFAIIIDEAHSSTSGDMVAKMNRAISLDDEEQKTDEDIVLEVMQDRKMLKNASYFAFTATPKNKTLETKEPAYFNQKLN